MTTVTKDPSMRRGEDTIMYSVERVEKKDAKGKGTGEFEKSVVEHHLPWDKNNKYSAAKFKKLEERGYTYERPVLPGSELPKQSDNLICPKCGRDCKGQFGLDAHMRSHAENK